MNEMYVLIVLDNGALVISTFRHYISLDNGHYDFRHLDTKVVDIWFPHRNPGPDVGKFKSEFPSDFHISKMNCCSIVVKILVKFFSFSPTLKLVLSIWIFHRMMNEFRSEISIAVFQKRPRARFSRRSSSRNWCNFDSKRNCPWSRNFWWWL